MTGEDDDDELVRVTHLVPRSDREAAAANTAHGEPTQAVRDVYRFLARGFPLEDAVGMTRIERVRRVRERMESEVESMTDEIAELESREAALRERVEHAADRREKFEARMDELETNLRDGMNVFPDHSLVESTASVSDLTPSEVIGLLRERNPDVPDHAFVKVTESSHAWRGVSDES